MIFVLLMYAIFAATFPIGKMALAYTTSSIFLIAVRMIISGILLLGYQWITDHAKFVIKREDIAIFLRVALYAIYLGFILEFWALRHIPSIKTNLMYSFAPFISAFLGYKIFSEHLGWRKIMGLIIGCVGMIPIIFSGSSDIIGADACAVNLFSISHYEVMLFAGICASTYAWFIIKDLMHKGYSLILINGIAMLIGGLLSLGTYGIEYYYNPVWPIHSTPHFFGYMAMSILLSNIIGFTMYGMLLRRFTATFLSFAGFTCPIFGAFYAYFFMGETIHTHYIIGFILLLAGLRLFYLEETGSKA